MLLSWAGKTEWKTHLPRAEYPNPCSPRGQGVVRDWLSKGRVVPVPGEDGPWRRRRRPDTFAALSEVAG